MTTPVATDSDESVEKFDCTQDRHDWSKRGTPGDRWLECWLCGHTTDDPAHPINRTPSTMTDPQNATETPQKPPCRSTGPSGQPCARRRGHTPQWHTGPNTDGVQENWTAGVNSPAVVYVRVPGPKLIPGGCVRCGSTKRRDPGGSRAERNPGVCARCLEPASSNAGPQSEADFLTWGNPRNGW